MKLKVFVILSLAFCVVFSSTLSGQNKAFEPGFYINQQSDTVRGELWVDNLNHPSVLKFKPSLNDPEILHVSFDSCKELSLPGASIVNWYGKRNMAYITKFEFIIKNQDSSVTASIPLRLLYKGSPLSLYYFQDETDHFFVRKENAIHELLISYRYLTDLEKVNYVFNPPTYIINPSYRYQLINLMGEDLSQRKKSLIENAAYEKWDLIKLFKKLDHSKN